MTTEVLLATSRVLWQGSRGGKTYTVIEWQYDGEMSWELFASNGKVRSLGRYNVFKQMLAALCQQWTLEAVK